jgi:hypothetical protein
VAAFAFSAILGASTAAHGGVASDPLTAHSKVAPDFVPSPPPVREVFAQNGRFVLLLHSPGSPASSATVGRLYEETRSGRKLIWERKLPQPYGPRYALVGSNAQVITFDEWHHVKSRYAIVLIHPQRKAKVTWSFEAIAAVLGEPASVLTAAASSGWWIQSEPRIDGERNVAIVGAANKCLLVHLDTGRLEQKSGSGPC